MSPVVRDHLSIGLDHHMQFKYQPDMEFVQQCMTDEALTQWAAGNLTASSRQQALVHIADCEDCRRAVSSLVQIAVGTDSATDRKSSHNDKQLIGRFEVQQVIGRGGMGMVVAAYDPLLDRHVALKVVAATASGDQLIEFEARLQREAQVLAAFRHGNVVAVHEAGRNADRFFMVLDLVDGQSLRTWLQIDQPTWRDALAILLQAGRAGSTARCWHSASRYQT
jgi:eukaryotic-like serine/threonine-protein kinase